jgi:DnaJ family protein C protein 7
MSNREYISKNPKELASHFKEEGNNFFTKKDYDIATIYFTKAIELDPDNSIYYANSISSLHRISLLLS